MSEETLAGKQIRTDSVLKGHSGAVLCLAFDAEGNTLGTGGDDGELRLWRVVNGSWQCVKTVEAGAPVLALRFHPAKGCDILCTGSADNVARLWKALRGDCQHVLTGHKEAVSCVSFDPSGQQVASGSHDGDVRVWSCAKGEQTARIKTKEAVRCVSYNPNGQLIIAGTLTCLQAYNSRTHEHVYTCSGHEGGVNGCVFHPKTEWLVSASSDKTLKVWRESDGFLVKEMRGHRGSALSCSFDHTGQLLASTEGGGPSGRSNSLWLWTFISGTRKNGIQDCINTHVLKGHDGGVTGCCFNPTASLLASSSSDKTVRLWRLSA